MKTKLVILAIFVSAVFCSTAVTNAGVVTEKWMIKRVARNGYIPSYMWEVQCKADAWINSSLLLNLTPEIHNASLYRIMFLYYLISTIGGNNLIPNMLRIIFSRE